MQVDGACHQPDIGALLLHRANAVRAQVLLEVDIDVGIGRQEAAEGHGQVAHGAAVRVNANVPFDAIGVAPHADLQLLHIVQNRPGVLQHGFAGRRQDHALLRAIEQRHADGLLQILQPIAGGGRSQMHVGSTHRQASRLGNGHEDPKVG